MAEELPLRPAELGEGMALNGNAPLSFLLTLVPSKLNPSLPFRPARDVEGRRARRWRHSTSARVPLEEEALSTHGMVLGHGRPRVLLEKGEKGEAKVWWGRHAGCVEDQEDKVQRELAVGGPNGTRRPCKQGD